MVAILAALPCAGLCADVFVDIANENDLLEDGSVAHPWDRIQEGIDAAASGDRVWVAPGSYKETVLMRDGVSLLSQGGAAVTIIDGTGMPNSVVTFNSTRSSPILRGFTITGGSGDQRSGGARRGGGILILASSPVITQTVITGNVIDQEFALGGGIYIYSAVSAPVIVDNVIQDNVALSTTLPDSGKGGGIYAVAKNGDVILRGNRIQSNQAAQGGGIYVQNIFGASAQVEGNILRDNEAVEGGGIYSHDDNDSATTMVNNLIQGNGHAGTTAQGGGIRSSSGGSGAFSIFNNTLVANSVPGGAGGALWLDSSSSSVTHLVGNNVVSGNTGSVGGGIEYQTSLNPLFVLDIRSNTFHANAGGDLHDAGGSGAVLADNQFTDPRFLAPGSYQLAPDSPCIDSADDTRAPSDDLVSFPRPFDGDGDMTPLSDRGAYEYPAGEVLGLALGTDNDSVSWPVLALQDGFHLYRGSLARLEATGEYTQDPGVEPAAALFCGLSPVDVPVVDLYVPALGEVVFYVASQTLGGWEGSLGETSAGLPRSNAGLCP